jgi:hypothetical protein
LHIKILPFSKILSNSYTAYEQNLVWSKEHEAYNKKKGIMKYKKDAQRIELMKEL